MNKSRWLWLTGVILVVVVGIAAYDPYSKMRIEENWRLARTCDFEAIEYLGDYYEKRGDERILEEVLAMERQCRNAK